MSRFVLGFAIGAAIGAAFVIFTAPRSGEVLRHNISDLLHEAREVAREAREAHESRLWARFRSSRTLPESAPTSLADSGEATL